MWTFYYTEILIFVMGYAGLFLLCFFIFKDKKQRNIGNIIGSPTGGGAACTDGSKDIVLRNTGIRLHSSQTYYEVVADKRMRNTVIPDQLQDREFSYGDFDVVYVE